MSDRTISFSEMANHDWLEVGAGRPRSAGLDERPLPILRVADVLDGRIETSFDDYPTSSDGNPKGSKISRPGDVVLTVKGTVGRVALMPADGTHFAYSPQLCFFRPTTNGPLLPRYLYYWFKSAEFWNQANALKGQTDMADYLSLSDVQSLRMRLPSRGYQVGVTEVLGALDDKIAVNYRVASTALALADALFERHASELTPGPQTFSSLADVSGGGTPRTSEPSYWDGEIAWTTPTDITALRSPYLYSTKRAITQLGLDNCASRLYPSGSIFMTSRATIGSFAIPQIPTAVNQGFVVVTPSRPELKWWLFHEMKARVPDMVALANGSTFLELSRKNFKAMPVRLASDEIVKRFDEEVNYLHEKAAKSSRETTTLAELRDALLPGLISGEIQIREAENVVGEAV